MCIGIPAQVIEAAPGRARVAGRGLDAAPWIDTALVGDCRPGDWLLVFLGHARERIDATRAAEVDAALALLAGALSGASGGEADPGFALPSAMSAAELAALAGMSETQPLS